MPCHSYTTDRPCCLDLMTCLIDMPRVLPGPNDTPDRSLHVIDEKTKLYVSHILTIVGYAVVLKGRAVNGRCQYSQMLTELIGREHNQHYSQYV